MSSMWCMLFDLVERECGTSSAFGILLPLPLHLGVHLAWWACMILPFISFFTRCVFIRISLSLLLLRSLCSVIAFVAGSSHMWAEHHQQQQQQRRREKELVPSCYCLFDAVAVVVRLPIAMSSRRFCFSHCFAHTCEATGTLRAQLDAKW